MQERTRYRVTFVTKIALLIAAFWTMADMFVVTPLLETLAGVYPDAPGIVINLCYCLSQGTIIIGSLFVSFMNTRMTKKSMMLAGGFLILIFGGFGGMVPGLPLMLLFRGIEGFGAGICITLIPTLINELFEDEKERNTLIGVQAAVGCVCGALVASLSGYIAEAAGWQYSYFLYFFSVVILLLIAFGVPKTPKEEAAPKEAPVRLNAASWGIFVMAILFGVLSSGMFGYVSYIIADTGLGGAAISGTASSFIQVGSFFGSVLMAVIYAKCRGFIEPIGWIAMCLGGAVFMAAAVIAGSVVLAYAGSVIFGFSNGLLFPWLYAKAAMVCAPNSETKTIAAANIGYYVGMFGAIFFYEALLSAMNSNVRVTVYFMVICSAVCAVYGLIRNIQKKGRLTPDGGEEQ